MYRYLSLTHKSLRFIKQVRPCLYNTSSTFEKEAELRKSIMEPGLEKVKKGKFKDAIEDFEKFIQHFPQDHAGYNNRGQVYLALGKFKEALEDFEKALKLLPDIEDAPVRHGLGCALQRLGRDSEAIYEFTRVLQRNPRHAGTFVLRATSYNNTTQFEKALRDSNAALAIEKNNYDAYCQKGIAHAGLGDFENALIYLTRAVCIHICIQSLIF